MTRSKNAIKQSKKRSKQKQNDVLYAQRLIKYFQEGEKTISSVARIANCSRNTVSKYLIDWDYV